MAPNESPSSAHNAFLDFCDCNIKIFGIISASVSAKINSYILKISGSVSNMFILYILRDSKQCFGVYKLNTGIYKYIMTNIKSLSTPVWRY